MRNSTLTRFVKLRAKASFVGFNFNKVVGQASDAVINMEVFLNIFWKDWQHEGKWNSKIKVYGLHLWDCGLSFPMNLGGKSTITYFIGENFAGESDEFFLKFCRIFPSRIFPDENCPQWKFFPMKNLTCRNVEIKQVKNKADNLLEEQKSF